MAVAREQPQCPKCNGYINSIRKKYPAGVVFVGDNFIGWDWEGHKCPVDTENKPCEHCDDSGWDKKSGDRCICVRKWE